MKLLAPKYYMSFSCTADKCKHSCCIGWEIDVDACALNKYNSLACDYAKSIIDSIDFTGSPHFKLANTERCPHLDENGLCKIIKNLDETYLCDICREHPRFYNYTNLGKEVGLGLSCEEACRLILNYDNYDEFIIIDEIDGNIEKVEFDAIGRRENLFKLLKSDTIKFSEKVESICESYNLHIELADIKETINNLEYLNLEDKDIFLKFTTLEDDKGIDNKLSRALAYFIYRHCSEACSFEEFYSSLGLAVFCVILLNGISNHSNTEEMARIISEEIEYSDDNTNMIKSLFFS